jgi:hypothetical protein
MEPNNTELKRNEDGTFAQGTAPGPGRPKGKTLKEFAREYFMLKTDAEKIAYIENLEKVKPGFAWQMGEGNPDNKTDFNNTGNPIIVLSNEVANKYDTPQSTSNDSK